MNLMGIAPMNQIPNTGAALSPLRQQIAQAMMGGASQFGVPPQGMRPQMGVMPPRGMLR